MMRVSVKEGKRAEISRVVRTPLRTTRMYSMMPVDVVGTPVNQSAGFSIREAGCSQRSSLTIVSTRQYSWEPCDLQRDGSLRNDLESSRTPLNVSPNPITAKATGISPSASVT